MPRYTDAQVRITERPGRFYVSWTADDAATFHGLRESFRAHISHARWDAEARAWWVRRSDESTLRYWLWVTLDADCITWDVAGDASGRTDEAHSRPQSSAVGRVDQAYRTLHLQPTAPPELVRAAHRTLAKLNHPDLGGSTAAMTALNQAAELIAAHQQIGAA